LGCALQDQGPFRVIRGFSARMFHALLPVGPQKIEAKAVRGWVDLSQKLCAKFNPESRFEQALKDRELNSLSMILTQFGDVAEPASTLLSLSSHIVGHKHHHAFLSPNEGRVGIQIAAEMARQQKCLRVRHQSKGNLLVQKWMEDLLLFAQLPGD